MDAERANVLPRRNATRAKRAGRHRSPDRLSVPSAAPALVLAVPAVESAAAAEIVSGIASVAASLCPGAAIHAGYADEGPNSLTSVLGSVARAREEQGNVLDEADGQASRFAAVVVPLALGPDPRRDSYFARIVAQAGPAFILTPYLSPHPVLGGALHDRLAEAGLVKPRRISGLSLVTLSVGVLVAAPGGEAARQTAEAASIMLAARLGMPVAPACLGSQASIDSGVATLRQSGATHLAIAPYVIGPELDPQEMAALAAAVGGQCSPPVGAHPALGQLATMRYGAALLEPAPAPAPRREPAPDSPPAPGAPLQSRRPRPGLPQPGPAQASQAQASQAQASQAQASQAQASQAQASQPEFSQAESSLLDRVRSGLVSDDVPTDGFAGRTD